MKRLLFSLALLPISVFAEGGLPNQPYIYVVGKAELQKPADIATLRFSLVARAPDQIKANQTVQTSASKVLALLGAKKIAADDVIAGDLTSEPEFEETQTSRTRGKLIDYKVGRPFEVRVRDVAGFPKLVDELIAITGVEFSGIDGSLSKEKEIEGEIRDKALVNAREEADKTLKTLNMKIDSVFVVSPVSPAAIENKIFGDITRLGVRSSEASAERAESPPEYRLAPVTVSQDVHIIYLISPAK